MRRGVAALVVLLMLVALAGAAWVAAYPPLEQFMVPGATDIRVTALGWNEWQLSYRAPGVPATWYSELSDRLEVQRWSSTESAGYGALAGSYSRATPLGFCELWEWAFLTFDPLRPASAQIRVRRWIAIASWWSMPQLAARPEQ